MANSVGIIDWSYRELIVPVRVHHPQAGAENKNETFAGGMVEIFGKRPIKSLSSLAKLVLYEKPHLFPIGSEKYEQGFCITRRLGRNQKRRFKGFGSTDESKEAVW